MTTNQEAVDAIARDLYGCAATLSFNHWELSVGVTGSFLFILGLFGYFSLFEHPFLIWLTATIVYLCGMRRWYVFCWRQGGYTVNVDLPILLGVTLLYCYVTVSLLVAWYKDQTLVSNVYLCISTWLITFVLFFDYMRAYFWVYSLHALQVLMQLKPPVAMVLSDNGWQQVPTDQIKIGDRIHIASNEHIPVDGVILSGAASINERMVTGKVTMVFKEFGDRVFAGSISLSGSFEICAEKVGEHTFLTKIIVLVKQAVYSVGFIVNTVKKYTLIFVLTIIALAIVTLFIWLIRSDLVNAFNAAVSVLCSAAVCAPFFVFIMILVVGIGHAAQIGILIKHVKMFFIARQINVLVLDKTGTLTYGKYKVQEFEFVNNLQEVLNSLQWPIPEHASAQSYVKAIICAVEALSEHAVASAVVEYLSEYKLLMKTVLDKQIEKFETMPGLGVRCVVRGHTVIIGSRKYMEQEQISIDVAVGVEAWAAESYTVSFIAFDNTLVAYFCVADAVREEASTVIKDLKAKGIKIVLITADDHVTANAVAQSVGIDHVLASIMPQDKAAHVRALQQNNQVVAMVGDGIQDTLLLAAADVGIAFRNGIDNTLDVADIVLLRDDMTLVPKIISQAQRIMKAVYQNIVMTFVYNAIAIPLAMGIWYLLFGNMLSPLYAGLAMITFNLLLMLHGLRVRIK